MHKVDIDGETLAKLRELSAEMLVSVTELLKEAIEKLHHEWTGKQSYADFERMAKDPEALRSYLEEAEALSAASPPLEDETEEWAALYPELNLLEFRQLRRK
jgi:hypothetical protein